MSGSGSMAVNAEPWREESEQRGEQGDVRLDKIQMCFEN